MAEGELSSRLRNIAMMADEVVVRYDDHGLGDFSEALERLKELCGDLSDYRVDEWPPPIQREIKSKVVEPVEAIARTVLQFKPQDNNREEHQNETLQTLRNAYISVTAAMVQFLAYGMSFTASQATSGKADEEIAEILSEVKSVKEKASAELASITGARTEADQLLVAQKEALSKTGVAEHAKHFQKQAFGYNWTAAIAAVTAIVLALILINGVQQIQTDPAKITTWIAFMAVHAGRVTTGLILVTGIVMALRVFAAERHNAVVNRHRQNALQTYRSLVEATTDPDTKEYLLARAATMIFSHEPSGYQKGPVEINQAIARIPGAPGSFDG